MRASGLLRRSEDGRQVVDLTSEQSVTIVKSDGSSLYMSRDIAAAIDRRTRFGFDRMIYVVDNSQAGHFSNLFTILHKVCKYQGSGPKCMQCSGSRSVPFWAS
jgi:arginyl-tRNA synthetase